DGQPENDKKVSSEVSVISDSSPIHEVHNQLKLTEQIEEVPKLMSTKNGQALIQEISRNLAESATSSSIQENSSICALSPNPPEISLISDRPNRMTKISETIANSSLSADEKEYIKMLTRGIDDETLYGGTSYENEAKIEKEE
ncbi:14667_t:CDS:2, partial [Funneliformis caledonium]